MTAASNLTADAPLRVKRWIPVSLKVLAVLLVGLAAFIGPAVFHNCRAILRIQAIGGTYATDPVPQLDWLGPFVGNQIVRAVVGGIQYVNLNRCSIDEGDFAVIARARNLRVLILDNTDIDDAALRPLTGLDSVRWLSLNGTTVSNAGLAHVASLRNLEGLDLDRTQVDDAGLSSISRLAALERLILSNTKVTDAGLPSLATLTNLRLLCLNGTDVTDTGIKSMNIQPLRILSLVNTNVTLYRITTLIDSWPDKTFLWEPREDSQ